MRFHYIASQPNGAVVEGDYEAQGPAEVLEYLAQQGLKPVSLKAIKGFQEIGSRRLFGQSITVTDKVFLTKYLALMLKVGTDLFRAINVLIVDFDKPSLKSLLIEIRAALEKGQPFYITFAKYPKYFSAVFINLIRAGEASGNLEKIFEELSIALQKEQELRHKIRSALIYPSLLLVMSLAILIILVTFALPKIAGIFQGSGVQPPLFSRVVFAIGLFFNEYLLFVILFLVILGVAAWYLFAKTVIGKKIIYQFISKAPIIGKTLQKIAIQRFANTLSLLLKAGLPILDALEITAQSVGSEELKNSLLRISREGIAKGMTIGEAFRREATFPRVVVNLMAISEKAGHIEDVLVTLATFYESEIESLIKTMVSFLEPVLLLFIGGVIGVIALAIIIPIYQLVGQF